MIKFEHPDGRETVVEIAPYGPPYAARLPDPSQFANAPVVYSLTIPILPDPKVTPPKAVGSA